MPAGAAGTAPHEGAHLDLGEVVGADGHQRALPAQVLVQLVLRGAAAAGAAAAVDTAASGQAGRQHNAHAPAGWQTSREQALPARRQRGTARRSPAGQ